MYVAIDDNYFWKGLYVDVTNYVRQCKQCSESEIMEGTNNEDTQCLQISNGADNNSNEKSIGHRKLSKVWQKVSIKRNLCTNLMIRNVLTRRREYGTYLATARRHRRRLKMQKRDE